MQCILMTDSQCSPKFPAILLLLYGEIFGGINFRQCGKGRYIIILNVIRAKNAIKILPMTADGEIGENFCVYRKYKKSCIYINQPVQ